MLSVVAAVGTVRIYGSNLDRAGARGCFCSITASALSFHLLKGAKQMYKLKALISLIEAYAGNAYDLYEIYVLSQKLGFTEAQIDLIFKKGLSL